MGNRGLSIQVLRRACVPSDSLQRRLLKRPVYARNPQNHTHSAPSQVESLLGLHDYGRSASSVCAYAPILRPGDRQHHRDFADGDVLRKHYSVDHRDHTRAQHHQGRPVLLPELPGRVDLPGGLVRYPEYAVRPRAAHELRVSRPSPHRRAHVPRHYRRR